MLLPVLLVGWVPLVVLWTACQKPWLWVTGALQGILSAQEGGFVGDYEINASKTLLGRS
jgi:hypothetical protein